jgi:hypothetical protein
MSHHPQSAFGSETTLDDHSGPTNPYDEERKKIWECHPTGTYLVHNRLCPPCAKYEAHATAAHENNEPSFVAAAQEQRLIWVDKTGTYDLLTNFHLQTEDKVQCQRELAETKKLLEKAEKALVKKDNELYKTQEKLSQAQWELYDNKETLRELREDLGEKDGTLTQVRTELRAKENALTRVQSDLRNKNELLAQLRSDLRDKETRLRQAQRDLKNTADELKELQTAHKHLQGDQNWSELHLVLKDHRERMLQADCDRVRAENEHILSCQAALRKNNVQLKNCVLSFLPASKDPDPQDFSLTPFWNSFLKQAEGATVEQKIAWLRNRYWDHRNILIRQELEVLKETWPLQMDEPALTPEQEFFLEPSPSTDRLIWWFHTPESIPPGVRMEDERLNREDIACHDAIDYTFGSELSKPMWSELLGGLRRINWSLKEAERKHLGKDSLQCQRPRLTGSNIRGHLRRYCYWSQSYVDERLIPFVERTIVNMPYVNYPRIFDIPLKESK